MPFLRAALIKKRKEESAQPSPPEIILPPIVVVPDVAEPEPEPEAEIEPVIEPKEVQEPEVESESVLEHVEEELQPEVVPITEHEQVPEPEAESEAELEHVEEELQPEPDPEPLPDTTTLPDSILEAIGEAPADPQQQETDSSPEPPQEPEDFKLKYDFTSGERYVDTVSTKTEFDKVLDELAAISKDLLSWQVEKFAMQHTGKFHGDFDKAESDAKKYEAFLGGYITNAAMTLYDNGYRDAAIKQLDQAKSILEARRKLEEETEATRTRVAENDDVVDLTDILGLFGD